MAATGAPAACSVARDAAVGGAGGAGVSASVVGAAGPGDEPGEDGDDVDTSANEKEAACVAAPEAAAADIATACGSLPCVACTVTGIFRLEAAGIHSLVLLHL